MNFLANPVFNISSKHFIIYYMIYQKFSIRNYKQLQKNKRNSKTF